MTDCWAPCTLEDHVLEVRTQYREFTHWLDVHDPRMIEVVGLFTVAVAEMLDHIDGLHDDNVIVRILES